MLYLMCWRRSSLWFWLRCNNGGGIWVWDPVCTIQNWFGLVVGNTVTKHWLEHDTYTILVLFDTSLCIGHDCLFEIVGNVNDFIPRLELMSDFGRLVNEQPSRLPGTYDNSFADILISMNFWFRFCTSLIFLLEPIEIDVELEFFCYF